MYSQIALHCLPKEGRWMCLRKALDELHRITVQYYVLVEEHATTKEIRFCLVKWNRNPSISPATKREVLGVYTDIDEVIGLVKLLVVNEKEKLDGVHK